MATIVTIKRKKGVTFRVQFYVDHKRYSKTFPLADTKEKERLIKKRAISFKKQIEAEIDIYKSGLADYVAGITGSRVNRDRVDPAGVDKGTILKSIDGGTSWIRQTRSVTADLSSVFFINSRIGWIVGENGSILKSEDGGELWATQNSNPFYGLSSVYFINDSSGFVVGNSGTLLRTTNGGETWEPVNSGESNHLRAINFGPDSVGWAVGVWGTVIKTKSRGVVWTSVSQRVGSSRTLHDVFFIDPDIGWAVGSEILKTTDGGKSWSLIRSDSVNILNSVHFFDENIGWGVGKKVTLSVSQSSIIRKTEDGGNNWGVQLSGGYGVLNSVHFVDDSFGWTIGDP